MKCWSTGALANWQDFGCFKEGSQQVGRTKTMALTRLGRETNSFTYLVVRTVPVDVVRDVEVVGMTVVEEKTLVVGIMLVKVRVVKILSEIIDVVKMVEVVENELVTSMTEVISDVESDVEVVVVVAVKVSVLNTNWSA
jgi:hypothetical protein